MCLQYWKFVVPLTLSLSLYTSATKFVGFSETDILPVVPRNDPNLQIEKIWDFDFEDNCLMIKFVPGNKKIITVHKTGKLRLYESIDSDVNDYIQILDIAAQVWSFGDHGLMSMEFHPDWLKGVHKLFIMYTGEPKDVSELPNNEAITPLRPPEWGLGPPGTTGYQWLDVCDNLNLDETGDNRNGLICEHPYYLDRVAVDMEAGTAYQELTLIKSACGSSTTHAPGHIMTINDDIFFSVGDGSQFTEFDYGWEDDGCYDPMLPPGQGVFRAIREDFKNGKVTRIPYDLIDSDEEITYDKLSMVARGLRQPVRMFYNKNMDALFIGDVGFGDAGTTERIFAVNDVTAADAPERTTSFGWPCVEGVRRSTLGEIDILDGASEQERRNWLEENGINHCDATYEAAYAFIDGTEPGPGADPAWKPPLFEYRIGSMDEEFPDLCIDNYGAITSVYFYQGDMMPEEYTNKLIFSDYAKQCTWYFDPDPETGLPDTTKLPKTLMSGTGLVNIATGNDRMLYGIDFTNARLLRLSMIGAGDMTMEPTEPPTVAPTAAPTTEMLAESAEMCFDSRDMPILMWNQRGDGEYEATLSLGVVRAELESGVMRTFGYNGKIPGPLIRMKPCGVYHLTLVNNLEEWNEGSQGPMNSYHYPTNTNIHLHGMHISGLPPGDDVFNMLEAGETGEYIYTVPCDHSGGTNWYHPHSHGSSSLQVAGGAAGMIVVESSPIEAQDMPMEIQAMPEQFIVIQDFDPAEIELISQVAKDSIYSSTIDKPFTLINGCEKAEITLEAGQWMHIHMLHSGMLYGAVVSVKARDLAVAQCDVGVMGKDGVWLAEVPRMLTKANNMYFSQASRVDIAIRCPVANVEHYIRYLHIGDPNMTKPRIIGTIVVLESAREPAGDLPLWKPCRPAYLMDLNKFTALELGDDFPIEFRQTINGEIYAGPKEIFHEIEVGETQIWALTGTDAHPAHLHVNHMQLDKSIGKINNYPQVPGWHVAGDWVDTFSGPGNALVRVRPERFIGPMVVHCHILTHEDTGMMVVMEVTGDGADAETKPTTINFGTCDKEIPESQPYNDIPAVIPGLIEAEEFDLGGEGVAYHNVNYASLEAPDIRVTEAVQIADNGEVVSVGQIVASEFLKYSVNVKKTGYYQVSITQSSKDPAEGMKLSLWADLNGCPPSDQKIGFLGGIDNPDFEGTGDYAIFEQILLDDAVLLKKGPHKILICFEANGYMQLDSITFEYCGLAGCEIYNEGTEMPTFPPTEELDSDENAKSVWDRIMNFFS